MFKYVEPEIAGGLGENTKLLVNVHPPVVDFLEYCFDGWLGDCIVEAFPCFLVTEQAKKSIQEKCLSGVFF